MDKFATLEPVRLYAEQPATTATVLKAPAARPHVIHQPKLGALPLDLHALVLSHLPLPDIPAYARCCRGTANIVRDGESLVWKRKWGALAVETNGLQVVLQRLEHKAGQARATSRAAAPPTIAVDDDFGDFEEADFGSPSNPAEMGDFVGAFTAVSIVPQAAPAAIAENSRTKLMRAHALLKPLLNILSASPHLVLTQLGDAISDPLATSSISPLVLESKTLRILSLYLSKTIQPVRSWDTLYASLRSAMDRFDGNLLGAFDAADSRNDESGMRDAAESSWQIWDSAGDWELGKVWAEKREIFYQTSGWDPMDNFTKEGGLAFDAMDRFMEHVVNSILENGKRAVRVFPPDSGVLISFGERIASEVVGEYITSLLTRAREIGTEIYLQSVAASFKEAWRIVDAIMDAAKERPDSGVKKVRAEDVVYQMFESNMDEYLDEEVESVKLVFETVVKGWDHKEATLNSPTSDTRFLASSNPAQAKRNVVNTFTNLLLLPVTIVPRTVGAVGGALMTGGSAAVQGIAMLNPARWGASEPAARAGEYKRDFGQGESLFDADEKSNGHANGSPGLTHNHRDSTATLASSHSTVPSISRSHSVSDSVTLNEKEGSATQLDLLLSLDVALELIHEDRKALKRVEIFQGYPGHYGHRVKDTIEELFILFLCVLVDGHVSRGFGRATERMRSWKPAEHHETANVAPLEQFFELVHIGDTIQSMVQVYFDKELAPHIDRTDFLNAVVREKKRFENTLDDCVAAGLNAGTEVLMNQVDHIITTLTKPREYYPPEDGTLDLGPTVACQEAIKCLETHCKLIKGSTSKEVLEVFYQEVGIRLIAILQKHIKRQIISLNGGFQVIADLNAYNNFVTSLKVQSIAVDFANLRMLGHVYVVEDAKDLAQIVRDVTRYGGAYRPEDIYEFIQRRSDWKKIEKVVDKTMYNLSFKEDCSVM